MNTPNPFHMNLKSILMICTVAVHVPAYSQIDEARMNRDVKIMQEALQSLFQGDAPRHFLDRIDGTETSRYIPGMGIMLQAPEIKENTFTYFQEDWEEEQDQEEDETANRHARIERILKDYLKDYGDLAQQLPADEYVMIRYSPKYETVIRSNRRGSITLYNSDQPDERFMVKVLKKDIDAYRSGKIDNNEFYNRIETSITHEESLNTKEYKVFASILESLYSSDNDYQRNEDQESQFNQSRFYHKTGLRNKVSYEFLKGYGVIYQLKLGYELQGYNSQLVDNTFSWSSDGTEGKVITKVEDGQVIIIESDDNTQDDEEETAEYDEDMDQEEETEADDDEQARNYLLDRDERIEDIYQDSFRYELKQYMVDYGRTLRSLEGDEFLIINVEMPACYECDLPANIELKIKREVLNAYETGEMDLEEAMDNIQVKESGQAKDLQDLQGMIAPKASKVLVVPRARTPISIKERNRRYRNDE